MAGRLAENPAANALLGQSSFFPSVRSNPGNPRRLEKVPAMKNPLLCVLLLCLGSVSATAPGAAEERISVLFLGDNGHHRPLDRAAQLIPVLRPRGIDIEYTGRVEDLNADKLASYDCLIIYANIGKISPQQEKALLDFVDSGKGFVPLHCASYCFLNSPKYIALVGAQFKSHGTGVFGVSNVRPDHPIMKGFKGFESWDETYVHTHHNEKNRTLLETRAEGKSREPWTWVRTRGKGRIFYTAWGHDQRTWEHPGFHELVERGIRWSTGADEFPVSHKREPHRGLEPFEFKNAKLPNYLPNRRWGTLGKDLNRMQKPVSPARSQKHMVLPQGFEAKLFAAEPDITKPITMTWDVRGRLWISETTDYPNEIKPEGKGEDRIKICEDTDGDGRADKFTIFADKLSIPTSLCFAGGGLIVHQAPHTLFLEDTDGDDRADVRRVLFSGWSTGDTHAGPSNMRWGFDNWVWGIVGYSGFNGRIGKEQHRFSTGFYRFRPDGSGGEFIRNTNNNSWGVGFSEEGAVFGSTANRNPSVYMPIANRYYEAVRGWSSSRLGMTSQTARFYPITPNVRQVDQHDNFTAGAGHALYTARSYPKHYWNRAAFVNGPTGHLVATFLIESMGSDYLTRNSWNLLASDDEWTAPILSEVGPDGMVWMIDWYNYIIQHNPTPRGYKNGRGNAYVTPLRDKVHGRIYRLIYNGQDSYKPLNLEKADATQLVSQLSNDNMFWRMNAQRLLVERGKHDVIPALGRLAADRKVDAIGLNTAAIHALWTLHGIGALDGSVPAATKAAIDALQHPSAGVRRTALKVAPRTAAGISAIVGSGSLKDSDGQVRLAAFLALSEMPPSPEAAAAIAATIGLPANSDDRWIPDAATSAAARHDIHYLQAVVNTAAAARQDNKRLEITERIAEHYARGAPQDSAGALVLSCAAASRSIADPIVRGLAKGWPQGRAVKLDDAQETALARVLTRVSGPVKGQLLSLAARWETKALDTHIAEVISGYVKTMKSSGAPEKDRIEAAGELVSFHGSDSHIADEIIAEITPTSSPSLARGLIDAVSGSQAPGTGAALLEKYDTLTPGTRQEILKVVLKRADWSRNLLESARKGGVDLSALSLDQKQGLARHPDKKVAALATKLLASTGSLPNPDRQKVIDGMLEVTRKTGNPARGKELYKKLCSKCHVHGGEGTNIGPELTGSAVHPKEELLIHILDPNRSVEGNFRQYTAVTRKGKILTGLLASENRNALEIYDAEGAKHVVLREDLKRLDSSRLSLMPEGFEKQMRPAELGDLLEFLTQRGRFLPIPLAKYATIVSTSGMFFSKSSGQERLIFPDWKPKTFEGVPFQLVDPRGNTVPNVIMLNGPNGNFPPKMPKLVRLPCNAPAKAIHFLSGISGWGSKGAATRTVSMIVRLHYADGKKEDHPLLDGIHFADYIGQFDVPGSKLAFKLRSQQLRYLAIHPGRVEAIREIELIKGPDRTAPIVMAITVEGPR